MVYIAPGVQLKNNSGETAADVGANDIARESIQRLLTGEETPGWALKNSNCIVQRPSNTVVSGASGSGSGSGTTLPPSKVGQQKPRTAPTVATGGQGLHSQIAPSLTGLPRGGTVGAMAGATPEFPAAGGTAAVATMAEARGVVGGTAGGGRRGEGRGATEQDDTATENHTSAVEVSLLPKVRGVLRIGRRVF